MLAAAQEISVGATAWAVLSELDKIFPIKEEQRTMSKMSVEENVFHLLPNGFCESLAKRCGALWLITGPWLTSSVAQ